MDIKSQKTRARLQAKALRAEVQDPAAPLELIRHFPAEQFRNATISGFWPLGDEIDVRPLLQALYETGHQLALPCTPRVGLPLVMRAWSPDDELKRGSFNTREPFETQPEIRPNVVLLPLLAFTASGMRLGYGGGFYDRTLAKLKSGGEVFACGVAYSAQEAAHLPTDKYDSPLDAILTEKEFRMFS